MNVQQTLGELRKAGWCIEFDSNVEDFQLPLSLRERYPRLPESLIDFLSGLSCCRNSHETAWFLCQTDYEGSNEGVYCWNEFELMDMAIDSEDAGFRSEVKKFWDKHFPFLLSVKSGYSYFAVSVQDHNFGAVVHGYEPEFTDASQITSSFEEFLMILVKTVKNPNKEEPLQLAL